jgi:hypothetical protein
MVNAKITNVGGHSSEATNTWFVSTERVRFMRIGTELTVRDGFYKAGDIIDFFFEFTKPVTLKNPGNPQLVLNSTSNARAVYNQSNPTTPSTKQAFRYIVEQGHSTQQHYPPFLNIIGFDTTTLPSAENYPFTWEFTNNEGQKEEVRLVTSNTGYPEPDYNLVETTTGKSRLMDVKNFTIDTTFPTLVNITLSGRGGWYGRGNTVFFEAEFSEYVYVGATPPRLQLRINNGADTTPKLTVEGQPSGNRINFSYKINDGDFTPGTDDLLITGIVGIIQDQAGNVYDNGTFTPRTPVDSATPPRGARIRAIPLLVPTLEAHNASAYSPSTLISSGATQGTSGGLSETWTPSSFDDTGDFVDNYPSAVQLNSYYGENLFIVIKPNTSAVLEAGFDRFEYSVNYGSEWRVEDHNTPILRTIQGYYALTARQVDSAGNRSPWSKPITFFWDRGDLLRQISTPDPSGTYTNNTAQSGSRADIINIVLTFRRPVRLENFQLSLNVRDTVNGSQTEIRVPASPGTFNTTGSGTTHTITIPYNVGQTDHTYGADLVVSLADGYRAYDRLNSGGADVTSMVNLDLVTGTNRNLHHQRNIKIQTGAPTRTQAPQFTRTNIASDDSVQGHITFRFNSKVTKGPATLGSVPNDIVIEQIETVGADADSYRLPGVLTAAQYELYKDLSGGGSSTLADFYKSGTSGYINGTPTGFPDTSTKYILDFNVCTFTTSYAGDPTKDAQIKEIARKLRDAEKVRINITSSFVSISEISSNPTVYEVKVTLNGTNSLNVPGASYSLSYLSGFVQDEYENYCAADSTTTFSGSDIGGLSRPFIRSSKPSERVSAQTGSGTAPRLYIEPLDRAVTAQVRMDTRTPGSVVRYATASMTNRGGATPNVDNSANNNSNMSTDAPSNDPARPTITGIATAANPFGHSSTLIDVGGAAQNTYSVIQGLRHRFYAVSEKGGVISTTLNTASFTEEMLYRTVLTFKGATSGHTSISMNDGDQLWVRGGNEVNNTTIAGFPLRWNDNYNNPSLPNPPYLPGTGEQAGIRLMTRINTDSTILKDSTWQWVTWDITVPAFIKVYLGRDTESTAAQAKQYGPRYSYVQQNNWTYLTSQYRLFPGEHRWLNSSTPQQSDGNARHDPFSFSAAPEMRPFPLANTAGFQN